MEFEASRSEVVGMERLLVSVVSPAYEEAENLPLMYERLQQVFSELEVDWEWVVVDDHSSDATFEVLQEISQRDARVGGIRLARRSGSHTALACALAHARGDVCIAMAADLQDPPETIPLLLERWRNGSHVVWAVRAARPGEKASAIALSRLYYWLMRNIIGMKEIPATGADFMLLDRVVVEAFRSFRESTVSVIALIAWLGFRQSAIEYEKAPRLHGRSGWRLRQKLKLVVDSITSFSYLPIRLISYFGVGVAILGFGYAAVVVANAFIGNPVQGWSSLMVVLLLVGGIQMMMIGVLGVYLWRTLDEARRRPQFIVEAMTARSRPDEVAGPAPAPLARTTKSG